MTFKDVESDYRDAMLRASAYNMSEITRTVAAEQAKAAALMAQAIVARDTSEGMLKKMNEIGKEGELP